MKVKEIIEILQKEDPETLVIVDGYEGDYTTPIKTHKFYVKKQEAEWYYGEYEPCQKEDPDAIKAILLPRQ
jgi:hypothetical protein